MRASVDFDNARSWRELALSRLPATSAPGPNTTRCSTLCGWPSASSTFATNSKSPASHAHRVSGAAVEGCPHGGPGFPGLGRTPQHIRHAYGDDGASHRPDQVDPPGGQVPDGKVGAEAAGRVHRGAVVGPAHAA